MQLVVKLIADGLVFPIALIGIYALIRFVPNKEKYQTYALVFMAGLSSYVVAKVAGLLYQPESLRPFELMGVEPGASYLDNPGFPSDHALFITAIVLAIYFGARHKKLALVALILSILVYAGRVIALVHSPLDIVGGILIACVGLFWYLPYIRSAKKSKSKTS